MISYYSKFALDYTQYIEYNECGSNFRRVIVMSETSEKNTTVRTTTPVFPIQANFSLVKFILLSIITFGIYAIYITAKMGDTMNMIASRYDGKRTMNYWLLCLIVTPLTFGIGFFVWNHKFSSRIGCELTRRQINYKIDASTFWLFGVLGSIVVIGPFYYIYKLMTGLNLLIKDYSTNG